MWYFLIAVIGVKIVIESSTNVQIVVSVLYVAYWAINYWVPNLILRRKLRYNH